MLFVGLGGTGGKIGAELERRLRRTLCGPDGANVIGTESRRYLPYQLPSCFQFVYADLDEREVHELRVQSAPRGDHERAVSRTAHIATNLVPVHKNYPDVAQSLRIRAEREVRGWLPPTDGEPRIAPLSVGAGQLPTVARACLFETIAASGIEVAQRPIVDAIHRLSTCGEELAALGGASAKTCEVFVAFSVAGGTGTGIFYDYLHLIAESFRNSGISIQIYPLVVMPSAFPPGQGGGKPAVLNAGRGLLDLFRLVDDQNTRDADVRFMTAGDGHDQGLSVTYPGQRAIQITPSMIQTAFLFSEAAGLEPVDLHRSIVSFILALAGVRNSKGGGGAEGPGAAQNSFINRGAERSTPAPSGIGSRGASTGAVATLAVPRGEILDILAAHLLSATVRAADRRAQLAENNDDLIHAFLTETRLTDLLDRPHHAEGQQVQPGQHGKARAEAVRAEAGQLRDMLRHQLVPAMARDFDPWNGFLAMLKLPPDPEPVDLLRAERAVFGAPPAGRAGMEPTPTVQNIFQHRATTIQVAGEPPADGDDAQDEWLARQVQAAWHLAWAEQRPVWEPKLEGLRIRLRALIGILREGRLAEESSFAPRVTELFVDRKAAPYLLPDLPREPDDFYRQLLSKLASALEMKETEPDETRVLTSLLGRDLWRQIAEDSADLGPERAVANFRRRIDMGVREQTEDGATFLSRLADLLAAASGMTNDVLDLDRDRFRDKLRGLIPAGLLLEAAGRAKILVSYPVRTADADTDSPAVLLGEGRITDRASGVRGLPTKITDVEEFLGREIRQEIGQQAAPVDIEFTPTAEESLTVVLIRTSLGVTDVPEVRDVMNLWSATLLNQEQEDFLPWRQRFGYHYDWLLTTERQRQNILHRLLTAMRNGQVDLLSGTEQSPAELEFRVSTDSGGGVARLRLRLKPFGPTSPWGSLLHAYEESTLGGSELNRQQMYRRLMNVKPVVEDADADNGQLPEGASIYQVFCKVAETEAPMLRKLRDVLRKSSGGASTRLTRIEGLLEFWEKTVPAARAKNFDALVGFYANLKELDEGVAGLTGP
jgi:Tubulin like